MKNVAKIVRVSTAVFALAVFAPPAAPIEDPVQWALAVDAAATPGGRVLAMLTATMEPGWHLYSLTTPKGGPNATTVTLVENPAVAGVRVYQPKPLRQMDPNFRIETETFGENLKLLVEIVLKSDAAPGPIDLEARVRYQCCTDKICLPPRVKTARAALQVNAHAKSAALKIPPEYDEAARFGDIGPVGIATPPRDEPEGKTALARHEPKPAVAAPPAPVQVAPAPSTSAESSLPARPATPAKAAGGDTNTLGFLLVAFGFGVAAIFTPCVFPMIPITVSFFLNQGTQGRRGSLTQALVFCLGIVVLFTSLGAATKAIAGPFGVVVLGSSPWVNGFVSLVFVVFGLSLLGAYELTLPSGMLTSLDRVSRGGGYAGTLLMGLTFSLTAFACVGPIVGPLLVASANSNGLQPILGMACFAAGLSAPFFLLALFPSYLKRLPRSGGWMVRVKIVLGFIVLAAALKYLSNIDQVLQLGFLTRGRFLAAWIVLFAIPGLYLLGLIRMEGIKPEEPIGVGRILCGSLFLIFAVSLVPGLSGSPLGELDAYVPVAGTASPGGTAQAGPVWLKNQYDEALAQAAREDKLVFVNFTGYACTNCHWMKANMFTRPEIGAALQGFVLVDLYTDGTDAESEKNQKFEDKLFSTAAIPFYAIFDAHGKVLATFPGLTRNPREFLAFLKAPVGKQAGS